MSSKMGLSLKAASTNSSNTIPASLVVASASSRMSPASINVGLWEPLFASARVLRQSNSPVSAGLGFFQSVSTVPGRKAVRMLFSAPKCMSVRHTYRRSATGWTPFARPLCWHWSQDATLETGLGPSDPGHGTIHDHASRAAPHVTRLSGADHDRRVTRASSGSRLVLGSRATTWRVGVAHIAGYERLERAFVGGRYVRRVHA